jgi:HEAT repeat protein
MDMLGRRGDGIALPAVLAALKDEDQAVRLASIQAAARLGGNDALPSILEVLKSSGRPDEINAVKEVLIRYKGERVLSSMAVSLSEGSSQAQVALLEVLAARQAKEHLDEVFPLTKSDDPSVRLAAIRALEYLAGEDDLTGMVELLLHAEEGPEKSAVQRAIVAVVKNSSVPEHHTDSLLAVLKDLNGNERGEILTVLARIGGDEALSVVVAETKSKSNLVKDAAIRALAEWPDASAVEELLRIAMSEKDLTHQVLALRGSVRIAEESQLSPAKKLAIYENAMSAATRPEEKKLILGGLAKLGTPDALGLVAGYLSDSEINFEAALAALEISSSKNHNRNSLEGQDVAMAFIETFVNPDVNLQIKEHLALQSGMDQPPEGFTALFNGTDLTGWKGLVENPVVRAKMSPEKLAQAQSEADSLMRAHWQVIEGILVFDGGGHSLCTVKDYKDFEMLVDWKIEKEGDSGIYLRGSPQVQIWDPAQWPEGSGGLYNNQKGPSKPLVPVDNPIGEWNTFRIKMIGERVTVHLNDVLVVDDVVMDNYWERDKPIYPIGQIELQSHNTPLYFRNIFIREIQREEAMFSGELFNGKDLTGWQQIGGQEGSWKVEDGVLYTEGTGGGWLSTEREFANFKLELEFRVPPGGNSGVFLRAPHEGDPAYSGMEIQVLDDYAEKYDNLKPWQYTGSIYAVQAAAERASKGANEWQKYVIVCDGPRVVVNLNGIEIVNTNLIDHMDKESTSPGLKRRSGFIGLQNHSTRVEYRNIRLTELR